MPGQGVIPAAVLLHSATITPYTNNKTQRHREEGAICVILTVSASGMTGRYGQESKI